MTTDQKEGGLSNPWVTEYVGVKELALGSHTGAGPLISGLTTVATVLTKQGSLSAL